MRSNRLLMHITNISKNKKKKMNLLINSVKNNPHFPEENDSKISKKHSPLNAKDFNELHKALDLYLLYYTYFITKILTILKQIVY